MTSLAVTLAVDSRGPCAVYIITDSRLTWDSPGRRRWDAGQKTFASAVSPDIFGYCGDALFASMVLRQILDQINYGILFKPEMSSSTRHEIVKALFEQSILRQIGAPINSISIFHGARENELMASRFRVWETRFTAVSRKWNDVEHNLRTDESYFAHVDGSGANHVLKRGREWLHTDAKGTSRAAIWSFCNALHEGNDPHSGGPPQLVGIWRKGSAQPFGFWWEGKPYLGGMEVPADSQVTRVNWFNHRFERCSGLTGKRLEGAQRHSKPKQLK